MDNEKIINETSQKNEVINNINSLNNLQNNKIYDNFNKENYKKSMKKLLIIIAGFLILAITGVFVYTSYINKPINLFKKAIEVSYKEVSNSLKELEDSYNGNKDEKSALIYGDIKLDSNIPELDNYLKYNYGFKLGVDIESKKMELGLSMSEESKKIIEVIMYILNNNVYLKSEQIYDKLLFTALEDNVFNEDNDNNLNYDINDVDILLEKLSKYTSNSLLESEFSKEKDIVKIDGRDIKVTKSVYNINKNTVYSMYKTIVNSLKNDEEALDILSRMTNIDKSEIVNNLNDKNLNESDFEGIKNLKISIYTKGFFSKVVGMEITHQNDIILSYVKDGNNGEFNIYLDNVELNYVINDKESNGKLKIDGKQVVSVKVIHEKNKKDIKNNLEFIFEYEDVKIVSKLNLNRKIESKNKNIINIDFDLTVKYDDQTINFGAILNITSEIGKKIAEDVNTTGALNVDDLTDSEIEKISTNLENAIKDTLLYDLLYDAIKDSDEELVKTSALGYVEAVEKSSLILDINTGNSFVNGNYIVNDSIIKTTINGNIVSYNIDYIGENVVGNLTIEDGEVKIANLKFPNIMDKVAYVNDYEVLISN